MFEVQDLKFATLATVSRCGMVWFSEDVLNSEMIFQNYLEKLKNATVEEGEDDWSTPAKPGQEEEVSPLLQVRCANKPAAKKGEKLDRQPQEIPL